MSIAQSSLAVTAGASYSVNVGAAATVGAVVVLNESPYGLNVSVGSSSQWIAAQTADLVPCDSMGFNGNLQITTDGYLTNGGSAPSFLVLFTTYAPGEAIRGSYPSPLARLTNGGNVGIASSLVNDSSPSGTQMIEARPAGAAGPYYTVTNNGDVTARGALIIAFKTGLLPPSVQLSDNGNDLALVIQGLAGPGAAGGYAFGAISNGNAVTPFGIAQSPGVSPLSWIDAAGVLHATAPVTLAAGNQETGVAGYTGYAPGAGNSLNYIFNFKTVMTNVPTSLTSSNLSAPTNANSLGFNLITKYGANMFWSATAAGISTWAVQYTTVGNCLLALNAAKRTLDHHCQVCGGVTRGASFDALRYQAGATPAETSMSYDCPACGATEHFTCSLSAADKADTTPQGSGGYATTRGAQATLIRQLMTALGLEVAP